MSHIVTVETEVRDARAVAAACRRLGLPEPVHERVKLFQAEAQGLAVRLPGWAFPAVCELASGKLRFDNFNGQWGARKELDRFLQAYAAEKVTLEARRAGYRVAERQLADGSLRLTVSVGA